MRKTAVFGLVVVVLLVGLTLPGVALQGGPPDHAEGAGVGPPDHANDGGANDAGRNDAGGNDGGEDGGDDGPDDGGDSDGSLPVDDVFDDDGGPPGGEGGEGLPGPDGEARGQQTSHDAEDPLPLPDDDEETPTPEPESTPDGEGGNGSGASSGPEGSADSSDGDGGPSVDVRTNDTATVANVTDVERGDTVEIDLRGPATEGERVAVESVAVGVGGGAPFTLTATRSTPRTDGAAAPGVPVAYFDVGTDAAVEDATLTLAVDESALPEGVEPADLAVLRRTADGWESTETTYDEEAGVYTVETSGFSTFAVAAPSEGPIEVTGAEVSEGAVGSGENATVVATVENTGDRQATRTLAATVDGETVATRELTLGGGESATVTFDIPADRVRNGTVAVDGVEAGRLQVESTANERGAAPSAGRNAAFGVGAAVLILLSAVGTGLLAARNEEWDVDWLP